MGLGYNETTTEVVKKGITTKQANTFIALCKMKGKERDAMEIDWREWDYDYMNRVIIKLQNMKRKNPPTEKQVEKIKTLCNETGTELPDFNTLEGGYGNSASKLIGELIELSKKQRDEKVATNEQIKKVVQMYACASIAPYFADLEIYEEYTEVDGVTKKIQFTASELKKILKDKKSKDVSNFIKDHKEIYNEWLNTRLSVGQAKLIRKLEGRIMNNANGIISKELALDLYGNTYMVCEKGRKEHRPPAKYNQLTDLQLMAMSSKVASKWIAKLENEVSDKSQYKSFYDEDANKRTNFFMEDEEVRSNKNDKRASVLARLATFVGSPLDDDANDEDFRDYVKEAFRLNKGTASQILEIIADCDELAEALIIF